MITNTTPSALLVASLLFLQSPRQLHASDGSNAWRDYTLQSIGLTPGSPAPFEFNAHELRNLRITQFYADIYLNEPKTFKWAGLAAVVSDSLYPRIRELAQSFNFMLAPQYVVGMLTGLDLDTKLDPLRLDFTVTGHLLGSGNYQVYKDLYWQHLAFQKCGLQEVLGHVDETLLREGWQLIDNGKNNHNQELVWDGNAKLLRYEQETTLQNRVYNVDRGLWTNISNKNRIYSFLDVPELAKRSFATALPSGDIGKFEDRWAWIEEDILLPARNEDLSGQGDNLVAKVKAIRQKVRSEIDRLEAAFPSLKLASVSLPSCPSFVTPPTTLSTTAH
jgi:hypothetical protein